ncbi:MAG: DUF167 domain-containing protein [Candidatus Thermoplasmatota archaeon]|jgi:uncharacterized protein YggU (UPF0235/DUF167 family)|nr:DUF167 domain-containing protein [Candidatus Thermoplasmatota archaeon]
MIIQVKVRRGNRKPEKSGTTLTVYTEAERVNNQANLDVMKQIASFFGVAVSDVRLLSGKTRTRKTVEVNTQGD